MRPCWHPIVTRVIFPKIAATRRAWLGSDLGRPRRRPIAVGPGYVRCGDHRPLWRDRVESSRAVTSLKAIPSAGLILGWARCGLGPRWLACRQGESGSAGSLGAVGDRILTEGWIAEFQAEDMADMEQLVPAELARERSRLDLQRFRRRVAMHLLADDAGRVGRTLADGGELLTDLRQMLGGPKYLDIIREFIY